MEDTGGFPIELEAQFLQAVGIGFGGQDHRARRAALACRLEKWMLHKESIQLNLECEDSLNLRPTTLINQQLASMTFNPLC